MQLRGICNGVGGGGGRGSGGSGGRGSGEEVAGRRRGGMRGAEGGRDGKEERAKPRRSVPLSKGGSLRFPQEGRAPDQVRGGLVVGWKMKLGDRVLLAFPHCSSPALSAFRKSGHHFPGSKARRKDLPGSSLFEYPSPALRAPSPARGEGRVARLGHGLLLPCGRRCRRSRRMRSS
jgi:hypothetical protein